ncbi:MAG: hypothetical protein KC684_04250 [Candidatus Omnitrophica bacterium]|nr:hypothetical protein [Candidatus Omnitrophota bacterium]
MKKSLILVLLGIFFVTGCASTPKMPEQSEAIVINSAMEETRQKALDALIVNGFELQEQSEGYIQGKRPNKIGLFVGSGGEIIGIWLESVSDNKTRVLIRKKKTMMGYVGQKNWEKEIRKEILGVGEWE